MVARIVWGFVFEVFGGGGESPGWTGTGEQG